MRTVIYARKSTEGEDRQVQSLEDQIAFLKELAQREGLIVAEVIEEARSAKAPNTRPAFSRLVKQIEAGRIQGVLTWSISRLGRNPVDGGIMAYLLQTGKLDFIRTAERCYRPEDNALLLSIESGMATAYIQDLRRNVRRGMQGKVNRGWHTCKAPVGYLNDPLSREIVPDPVRFPLVRRGFDLILQGKSLIDVHRDLTSLGLTTSLREGVPHPISRAHLYQVLRHPFYRGDICYMGQLYPGKHRPMISKAEYAAVQQLLSARGKKHKKGSGFPFSGTMQCLQCGCAVVGEARYKHLATGRKVAYIYYHCSGAKGCPKRGIREEALADELEKVISTIALPPYLVRWLEAECLTQLETELPEHVATARELSTRVETSERRLERLTELRLDGEISEGEFASLRTKTITQLNEAREAAEAAKDLSSRLWLSLKQRFEVCELASHLPAASERLKALADVASRCGGCFLDKGRFEFQPDPIYQKIAAFEPLREGSERPKRGDSSPANLVWWTFVADLLKVTIDSDIKK